MTMVEYISILPDAADVPSTSSHRYLRLPHPRSGQPQLYLPYVTEEGKEVVLEVVKLNGAKRRTWFIGDSTIDSGAMLMHVPIDPLFLVIPLVFSLISSTSNTTPFQPLSDLISTVTSSPHFALNPAFAPPDSVKGGWNEDVQRLLRVKAVRRVFKLCCEKKVVPSGPPTPPPQEGESTSSASKSRSTTYYRPSMEAMITLLTRKVEHFAEPAQFNSFDHLIRSLARDGLIGDAKPDLVKQARLKASLEHIAQYLPAGITSALQATYNFTELQEYHANRTAAMNAAQSAPITSNKDKATAGTKRKATSAASRGVEKLKKVNTSSMNKLTSFFKPKT